MLSFYTRFRNGARFKSCTLTTGDKVTVRHINGRTIKNCLFVKVTERGFNLIDLDTNRAILKRHVYSSKKRGEYPARGDITVTFFISYYYDIRIVEPCIIDNPVSMAEI